MTKPFVALIAVVVVLGASIGGAFAGGVAVGKGQGSEEPTAQTSLAQNTSPQTTSQTDPQSLQELRGRAQSGTLTEGELQQFRQQFQGGGDGGPTPGFAIGQSGLVGEVESIEGDTILVNTPQGVLTASVTDETSIQVFKDGTLADLLEGMQVTVVGERGEDGSVQAASIVVLPEGAGGFGGFQPAGPRFGPGGQGGTAP
ncbi:MAG: hypothetical protein L0177_01970 [Chloroflexi bacterium]|nr:hypothetical protein [Chloroflexota bacterium]